MKKIIFIYFFIIINTLVNAKVKAADDFFLSVNKRLDTLRNKKINSKNLLQYNRYEELNIGLYENKEIKDYNDLGNEGISIGSEYATRLSTKFINSIYKDSQISFNFNVDDKGKIKGNSKLILDIYKNKISSFFIETTAKVKDTRHWTGNIGIGQKLKIMNNWLFIYRTSLDHDFEETNQKGSFGVELHHKNWLKISSNYYLALSDIRDFQNINFTKDRFANEWETNIKTSLPFYKKLSFNASFSKIYNDNIKIIDKNYTNVYNLWSYGIEYKPTKSLKTFLKKKNTKSGIINTEVGLDFIYKLNLF